MKAAAVTMPSWPRLLNVEMTAMYLGLGVQTVRNHHGELPGRRKLGGHVVYDRLILDKWIDRNNGRTDLWVDAQKMLG